MKMHAKLGDPLLIFVYSLSLLLLGCAIGIYWRSSPSVAVGLTIAGASLMVLHDTLMSLIWFWIAAKWSQQTARAVRNKLR